MNQNELDEILHDHRLWLSTEGREGEIANLRRADLREADLREADLRRADLREANLRGADLKGADFEGANLKGADFEGANLKEADLEGAWLDSDWKGISLILGNVLVTECEQWSVKSSWQRIKTWSAIKEDNQELYEELYL